MKYRLNLMMIISLSIAFYILLTVTFAYGIESAFPGLAVLGWLIAGSILHLAITGITDFSKFLVDHHEEQRALKKRKRKNEDAILPEISDEVSMEFQGEDPDNLSADEEIVYGKQKL